MKSCGRDVSEAGTRQHKQVEAVVSAAKLTIDEVPSTSFETLTAAEVHKHHVTPIASGL